MRKVERRAMLQHAHWFSGYVAANATAEASWELLANVKRSMPSLDDMVYDYWESPYYNYTPDFNDVWDGQEYAIALDEEIGAPSYWYDEHPEKEVGDLIVQCMDYAAWEELYKLN